MMANMIRYFGEKNNTGADMIQGVSVRITQACSEGKSKNECDGPSFQLDLPIVRMHFPDESDEAPGSMQTLEMASLVDEEGLTKREYPLTII